jgi:hypothetical protein
MSKILTKHLIGSSEVSFVDAPQISVPNTQIANRSLIKDPSQDMKANFGIDRLMVQHIDEMLSEFGPNGEKVFKSLNDDRDLVRFVGTWTNDISNRGQRVITAEVNAFIEVTFYGTGLNALANLFFSGGDVRITVDGGAEGSNLLVSYSNPLDSRNYSSNQILPLVSGLSLGLHTVKIRNNNSTGIGFFGFEILTENTQIRIAPGAIVKDQKRLTIPSAQNISVNPGVGSKGGRVVVYSSGGVISQAYQAVDAVSQTLSSTNHSNEEMVRRYNWREFGAGRSDDFSYVASSSAVCAFTLDDGTTSLVTGTTNFTPAIGDFADGFGPHNGSSFALTFIGTGLDIEPNTFNNGLSATITISIDGTQIFSGVPSSLFVKGRIAKIVSGLPYGTHVMRIAHTSAGTTPFYRSFYVYQPKKPTIPAGAVELADYNVMADFAPNTVAGIDTIATGVMRKMLSVREATFVGSWTISGSPTDTGLISQFATSSSTSGNYAEYTFFGTGFEWRGRTTATRANNVSVSLNGLAATTANFPTMVTSVYGGPAFAAGVLNINAATQDAAGFRLSGLPLGKYTVRFTNNTSSLFSVDGFDIITPVHSPKSNISADLQNTLRVGSQSLSDSRQILPFSDSEKFRGIAVGISSNPTTSSTSYVPVPDLSLVVPSKGGWFTVGYNMNCQNSGTNLVITGIFINGSFESGTEQRLNGGTEQSQSTSKPIYLAAGIHKIDVYWRAGAGTNNSNSTNRQLFVEEL